MSENNVSFLNELVNLVISNNDEVNIDVIIKDIDNELRVRAKDGFTTHLIQITCNPNYSPNNSVQSQSTVLHLYNDAIKYKVFEAIGNHYKELGFNVFKRNNSDNDLLISWNKKVLDYYGYEF